jgi:hypothetical protein
LAFAEPQPAIAVASSLQRQRYEEKTTPANLNAKKARKKARCHFSGILISETVHIM